MTSAEWDDDEQLLADLQAAVAAAPEVSEEDRAAARAAARAAWSWRTVDEELALGALVLDTRLQPVGGLRAAGATEDRTLVYSWPGQVLEIAVLPGRLAVQVIPDDGDDAGAAVSVAVFTAEAEFSQASVDDTGSAVLARPAQGPIRLVCRGRDQAVRTEWFTP